MPNPLNQPNSSTNYKSKSMHSTQRISHCKSSWINSLQSIANLNNQIRLMVVCCKTSKDRLTSINNSLKNWNKPTMLRMIQKIGLLCSQQKQKECNTNSITEPMRVNNYKIKSEKLKNVSRSTPKQKMTINDLMMSSTISTNNYNNNKQPSINYKINYNNQHSPKMKSKIDQPCSQLKSKDKPI